ncbi:MAG: FHA domain-containing protein [Chloroflexi bacterium]|nr:FHA domain-containing protein [Chloroflexota bacterium]
MKNVYLAYAPEDEARAEEVRRILLAQGHRPWINPQPAGDAEWHPGVEAAIQAADALIVLLTAAGASSIPVTYAWAFALGASIPVFALVFETAAEHPRLQLVHRYEADEFGDENHFWDHFVGDFKRQLDLQSAERKSLARPIEDAAEIDRSVMPSEPGYWLVMRRGPLLNKLFRLEREVVNLGRDLANDIVIRDAQVSRYHLRLTLRGGDYHLEDLGSSNGTRVNGAHIGAAIILNDGDFIAIGETVLLTYDLVYED